jgi:anti-sigma B factor antagonist
MMKIIEKENNRIAIVGLVGDPLGEPDAMALRKKIAEISHDNIRHVIIDLEKVKHINSAGLGGLISAMFTMVKANGSLTFASAGANVKDVFRITNLIKVFTLYDSVDEALKNHPPK